MPPNCWDGKVSQGYFFGRYAGLEVNVALERKGYGNVRFPASWKHEVCKIMNYLDPSSCIALLTKVDG